ncbi:hypothetical protein EAE96_004022 [Botrytis aclada]|nr:hypothetical protein EAE96_004022 [Botrytis aclada]
MPNWKTYEATVRLLSAIVAAHPNLKFDYAEISKYYGDESNYHQIWRGINGIKRNAERLRKAVDAGLNASTVNLQNDFSVKKKISDRFGGDCTFSAIDNRFRRLKSDAKLINDAVAKGEDPILMNVGDTNGEIACKRKEHSFVIFAYTNAVLAISQLMGSATPASHIQSQFRETIKPLGERLIATRDAGEDCKDVDLTDLGTRRYKAELILSPEVAKYMGSDVTPTAVKIHYNANIRSLSRRQIALFDAGKDPLEVSLNNPKGETARIMGSDTTVSSLKNHFQRTVKVLGKRQMSMLAAGKDSRDASLDGLGGEIVAIMGSDVTVDAIKQQISKRIKVLGSRQTKMRTAGQDPKNVDLEGLMPSQKEKEMDKFMGDSTVNGLRFQFDTR